MNTTLFLSVPDSVSFIQVCRAFRALAQYRSFWLNVVRANRLTYPLPCSPDESFLEYRLDSLKDLVFRAFRARAKATSADDQLPLKQLFPPCSFHFSCLSIALWIPPTATLLSDTGAECWNYETRRKLCSLRLNDPTGYSNGDYFLSQQNQSFGDRTLVLCSLRWGYPTKQVYFSYKHDFPIPTRAAINDQIAVVLTSHSSALSVVAFNLASTASHLITTDIPWKADTSFVYSGFSGKDLLILIVDRQETVFSLYRISRAFFPYDNNSTPLDSIECYQDRWTHRPTFRPPEFYYNSRHYMLSSINGLVAELNKTCNGPTLPPQLRLTLLDIECKQRRITEISVRFPAGTKYTTYTLDVRHSSRCTAIMILIQNEGTTQQELYLLQYDIDRGDNKGKTRGTLHRLGLYPVTGIFDSIIDFAVDDGRGQVLILTDEKSLHCLSYV